MAQKVTIYNIGTYIVEVECPRCHKKGKIAIPEIKFSKKAFAKCPRCGLVYDDSYFTQEMAKK